jgi:hypothetical protein
MSILVTLGKNTFKISENIMQYDGRIISHTYNIGGDYGPCVTVSYKYSDNIPISASLPHLLYEPECSVGGELEKGKGTETMIKAILRHAFKKVPSISKFFFDDMSHIDCNDKDLSKNPPRKAINPLNLAYFSIIYHGMTWYERVFRAEMVDKKAYRLYKERLSFLDDPAAKPIFHSFLEIAQPPKEHIESLEALYTPVRTYREFFQDIPRDKRCDVLYPWLHTFMKHYIGDVFTEKGWEIDMSKMSAGGGRGRRTTLHRVFHFKQRHHF